MRRLLSAGLCLLLAGCLGDSTAPPASELAGTWALVSVNGQPIPYTYSSGSQVTGEVVVINADGSYVAEATYANGTIHHEDGAYTVLGSSVDFLDVGTGYEYMADWNAIAMTQHVGSYELGFRKQGNTNTP